MIFLNFLIFLNILCIHRRTSLNESMYIVQACFRNYFLQKLDDRMIGFSIKAFLVTLVINFVERNILFMLVLTQTVKLKFNVDGVIFVLPF